MNLIHVYALNEREFYPTIEYLTRCVEKRIKKGLEVTNEYLAHCSSMSKLTFAVIKYRLKYDGVETTKDERNDARKSLAKYIIDSAKSNLEN